MPKGFYDVPLAINEPVLDYAPGSPERERVAKAYKKMYNSKVDVPLYINGEHVKTGDTATMAPPHDHKHILGTYHRAKKKHIEKAIRTALRARKKWADMPWENRAGIFLRAAELIAGPYRAKINAATMLGQSKTIYQAEIDAACELIDFLRFNVQFMAEIYSEQPESTPAAWNRLEYRPLEGFVYAVTPFNFTAIAGNLPASAALMGNVV
ncbi:MAG: aldehyde dehydrogenase family protein, partial [Marinirhabdus sp.]